VDWLEGLMRFELRKRELYWPSNDRSRTKEGLIPPDIDITKK
jgi:hypothetical protein